MKNMLCGSYYWGGQGKKRGGNERKRRDWRCFDVVVETTVYLELAENALFFA